MDEEYDQEYIQEFLESFKGQLICMKGNCDSNIDIETKFRLLLDKAEILMAIKEYDSALDETKLIIYDLEDNIIAIKDMKN